MTAERKDGLDQFRKWLVPLLLSIISFLVILIGGHLKTSFETLNAKVDGISLVIQNQIQLREDVKSLAKDLLTTNKVNETQDLDISDLKRDVKDQQLQTDRLQYNSVQQTFSEARKRLRLKYK